MDITTLRKAFEEKLAAWAKAHGYSRRGNVWRAADHYLAIHRDGNDAPFYAAKHQHVTGEKLSAPAMA